MLFTMGSIDDVGGVSSMVLLDDGPVVGGVRP